MSVGEAVWGLIGLVVLGTVLLGGLWALLALGRDLIGALHQRLEDGRSWVVERRQHRLWAEERAALEARHLVGRFGGDGSPIISAAQAGDLLVTGHLGGQVRLHRLSCDGELLCDFETGAEAGPRMFVSPDGALLATADRSGTELSLRGLDGAPLGAVTPDGPGLREKWLLQADDQAGYLPLDQRLDGAAFGADETGAALVVAWDLRYGPDGGPGSVYGSAATLVRRYHLAQDRAAVLAHEALQDLGSALSRGAMAVPGGRAVTSGRRIVDAATGETCPLPAELAHPLAATPYGVWLAGETGNGPRAGRCEWALWDLATSWRGPLWEDAVTSGLLGNLSAVGRLFAATVRETRRDGNRPEQARTVALTPIYETGSSRILAALPVTALHLAFTAESGLLAVEAGGMKVWRW